MKMDNTQRMPAITPMSTMKMEQQTPIVKQVNSQFIEQQNNYKFSTENAKTLKKNIESITIEQQPTVSAVNEAEQMKEITNFMDKAIEVTPDAIMASVQEAFKDIMTNPKLKEVKKSLAMAALSAGTVMGNVNPAMAISGNLSYTQFMNQINENMIKAVNIDETGRVANYLANDGGRGAVQLIPDADLI